MHNFKVGLNDDQYKVYDRLFKLPFMGGIVIIKHDMPEIPLNAFNFKDFGEILTKNYHRDLLVDKLFSSQLVYIFFLILFA